MESKSGWLKMGAYPYSGPLLIPIGYSSADDESGSSQITEHAGEPLSGVIGAEIRSVDAIWTYDTGFKLDPPK